MILLVYVGTIWDILKYIYLFSTGTEFIRQNLASINVRFWHLNSIPAIQIFRMAVYSSHRYSNESERECSKTFDDFKMRKKHFGLHNISALYFGFARFNSTGNGIIIQTKHVLSLNLIYATLLFCKIWYFLNYVAFIFFVALMLLNCFVIILIFQSLLSFFIHLKLTQFPASNDQKIVIVVKNGHLWNWII